MSWLTQGELRIRPMIASDIDGFADAFAAQNWDKPRSQYERYLQMQASGEHQVIVAAFGGRVAGYVTLVPEAQSGPFAGQGIPEIVDFNVLIPFRRQGIGTRLLDVAESLAAEHGDEVSLGVGLYADYGSAQRMYARRGYVPDGSGIWQGGKPVAAGATCINDDDLVLYMRKPIRRRADVPTPMCAQTAGAVASVDAQNARSWAELCARLWPDHTPEDMLKRRADGQFPHEFVYMLDDRAVAMLSMSLRHDYVEGTDSSPVGYVEGIYVLPEHRNTGIARMLIDFAKRWSAAQGCTELASDCELTNADSRAFHRGVGFTEANTIVCFAMRLSSQPSPDFIRT